MGRYSIIALFLYRRRKRRRDRLLWVHPIIKKREEFGAFYALFDELRDEANMFLNYFRMLVSSFDKLHRRLEDSLQRRNTKVRNYIQLFFLDVLLTVHLSIFISVINQLDAQKFCFTISLFHASTCFEHMCSSSGRQNCIIQPLHLCTRRPPIGVMIPEAV